MLKLIDGGRTRRVYGSLERAMRTAFVQMHGADGTVPSESIYDIRRGRQAPWRKLAKRIAEAHDKDTPIEQVREIVRALDIYIDELYHGGNAA